MLQNRPGPGFQTEDSRILLQPFRWDRRTGLQIRQGLLCQLPYHFRLFHTATSKFDYQLFQVRLSQISAGIVQANRFTFSNKYRHILIMVKFGKKYLHFTWGIIMTSLITKLNMVTFVTCLAVVDLVDRLLIIFWSAIALLPATLVIKITTFCCSCVKRKKHKCFLYEHLVQYVIQNHPSVVIVETTFINRVLLTNSTIKCH